ncbi:hypothetical protein QO034_22970 [Sedimentitalea sp. JM2-8]|uniref:Uncharacterized protein n=1 Tax=Sedimentitalea xiamensis TaxID=3050037 RepID=A0ABT7FL80_9RHOB|nr:hypothetical protein [Sedimentitalea xiamensis]MDK3075917.1 hypothetical protein [Sedimentitalea xiamensis]
MTEQETIQADIAQSLALLRAKLGIRAKTAHQALEKARRLLPGSTYAALKSLADAEPFLGHPRLWRTLDGDALKRAARDVQAHLDAIDAADRRKGWWLGMLGGLSFNLIAMFVLLLIVLVWRGFL